jgi:predicted ATPase
MLLYKYRPLSKPERVLDIARRLPERVRLEQVELGALSSPEVGTLLADGLGAPPEQVAELAGVVIEKTGGNPFFVQQFVQARHQANSLAQSMEGSP